MDLKIKEVPGRPQHLTLQKMPSTIKRKVESDHNILICDTNITIYPKKKVPRTEILKTQFKIMVEYQVPRESIFSTSSSKYLASLSLAQHYWGGQTRSRNAKSQTVCFQGRFWGPLNRIVFTPVNISIGPCLGGVLKKIQPK